MVNQIFRLSNYSLSLFRIGLGLIIIADLILRLQLMGLNWYTDSTMEEGSALDVNDTPHKAYFHQLWFYRGSYFFQQVVFTLHFLVSFAFLIGYKTQYTTILLWIATTSLHGRSDYLNGGEDKFSRILLTWAMFLPTADYYSVDAYLDPSRPKATSTSSFGVVGLMIQTFFLYSGGIACRWRSEPMWWATGGYRAMWHSLNAGASTSPLGEWAAATFGPGSQYFDLCGLLTFLTTPLELITPLFLYIPMPYHKFRWIGIFFLALFHILILPVLWLPFFQASSIVGLLPYIPIFREERLPPQKLWQGRKPFLKVFCLL